MSDIQENEKVEGASETEEAPAAAISVESSSPEVSEEPASSEEGASVEVEAVEQEADVPDSSLNLTAAEEAPQEVEAAPVAEPEKKPEPAKEAKEETEEEEVPPNVHGYQELSEERAALPWFVVNTYSGYEMNAKKNLEERIRARGLEDSFGNVLIPQETVVELVRGQKKTSTRKFFPGYILVQMDLTDETWHVVKDTPKVTGFIGDPRNPSPLSPEEVGNLLQQMEGGASRPRPRVQFEEGDAIKVIDGPFTDFNGTVDEVKPDKGKLRVLISIFGRNTPVELDFVQVEKA